jgi:YgiT-type zinc finger domain-containing protein
MKKSLGNRPCTECGGTLKSTYIDQDFERGCTAVRLCGIRAWVCENCGEAYFLPGGAQKVVEAANALFQLAETEKQHGRKLAGQVI